MTRYRDDGRIEIDNNAAERALRGVALGSGNYLFIGCLVQQQFLASAAHELKTPPALLRAELDLSQDQNRARLLGDGGHLVRQVHQLLHLAEVSELGNFSFETIDLWPVLLDAGKLLPRLAERHAVDVQLVMPNGPVMQRADASAVFVLVKNLGENAILHAGEARLVTIARDADGLRVRDRGTGIDPDDKDHVFKRFWCGPKVGRPGAGLGLAICAEVGKAHGRWIEPVRCGPWVEFRVGLRGEAEPRHSEVNQLYYPKAGNGTISFIVARNTSRLIAWRYCPNPAP